MSRDPGASDAALSAVTDALDDIASSSGSSFPVPGAGHTRERFARLADWAEQDLSLGRLAEGHVDALAILAEAGMSPPVSGATYGVWAARSSHGGTVARLEGDGWHLAGEKPFCSGVGTLQRALLTADAPDGYRLFDISLADNVVEIREGTWAAIGMADSRSETALFGGPPIPRGRAVGGPGFYLERPGFWFGGTGVAACWFGGARGLLRHTIRALGAEPSDLVTAEIGRARAHVETMRGMLELAADEIDADPGDAKGEARRRALITRQSVHHACTQVLDQVAAAAGARPLCHDRPQARRAADLYVYLAQHHGPQGAADLGRMTLDELP
jgi:alkylation response protein AidB-like acyl-CoA dehydrogenase